MSPETDILIVGYNEERFQKELRVAFRHWQVYACASPFALEGRRFTTAYFTPGAVAHRNWVNVRQTLDRNVKLLGAQMAPISAYKEPLVDVQGFEDAVLLSNLRRSRHAEAWT